jgi:hypothetical protein
MRFGRHEPLTAGLRLTPAQRIRSAPWALRHATATALLVVGLDGCGSQPLKPTPQPSPPADSTILPAHQFLLDQIHPTSGLIRSFDGLPVDHDYHDVCWTRDLVSAIEALRVLGDDPTAARLVDVLVNQQDAFGRWARGYHVATGTVFYGMDTRAFTIRGHLPWEFTIGDAADAGCLLLKEYERNPATAGDLLDRARRAAGWIVLLQRPFLDLRDGRTYYYLIDGEEYSGTVLAYSSAVHGAKAMRFLAYLHRITNPPSESSSRARAGTANQSARAKHVRLPGADDYLRVAVQTAEWLTRQTYNGAYFGIRCRIGNNLEEPYPEKLQTQVEVVRALRETADLSGLDPTKYQIALGSSVIGGLSEITMNGVDLRGLSQDAGVSSVWAEGTLEMAHLQESIGNGDFSRLLLADVVKMQNAGGGGVIYSAQSDPPSGLYPADTRTPATGATARFIVVRNALGLSTP